MVLHCNLDYFAIFERELDVAFIDGDFLSRGGPFFKLDEAPLVDLEEDLNILQVGEIDVVIVFLLQ